ncbi:hypothetical protein MIZ01_2617 [Sideroxyarcus emersonii]|uniref:Uncharacterized protein n=1 Tax=Sideroxyarcus emersonii TaxID=2764705 RepID=A0AAN1XC82_9PROT|nr:hypothetical protein [Sideroxyarcus emersonii]BCK88811.1 hypothetical protein MIZ01_2617 [Sideroxyarcus emersonii]
MEITLVGWFLILFGPVLFIFAPNWLYFLAIFLIPFSATAVINMSVGGELKGVPAILLVGSLWLGREFYALTRLRPLVLPKYIQAFGAMCLLYIAILACSLVALWQMPNQFVVHSPRLDAPGSFLLSLSAHNITQFLYAVFWILMTLLIVMRNQNEEALIRTIRIFVMSAVFVSCWGIFQWAAYHYGFDYPQTIFNSSETSSARGFTGVIKEAGFKRITSVAVEASILAQFLLAAVPLLMAVEWFKSPIFSIFTDRMILVLLLLVLLLSTSSTSYLGIFVLLLGFPVLLKLNWQSLRRYIFLAVAYGLVEVSLIAIMSHFTAQIDQLESVAIHSYSIEERIYTIHNAWQSFLESPVLGLGWGSVTSHDLFVNLLANSGLIGLWGFILLIFGPLSTQFVALEKSPINNQNAALGFGILSSFLLMLAINIVSGFSYVFGHFWLLLALLVSSGMLLRSNALPENRISGGCNKTLSVGETI